MAANNKKGTTYNLATSTVVDGKKVWTNWGSLFIREGGGSGPFPVAVGDFNRNGFEDLAVANFHSNNLSVLINKTRR
jgi:hypothetical protein